MFKQDTGVWALALVLVVLALFAAIGETAHNTREAGNDFSHSHADPAKATAASSPMGSALLNVSKSICHTVTAFAALQVRVDVIIDEQCLGVLVVLSHTRVWDTGAVKEPSHSIDGLK